MTRHLLSFVLVVSVPFLIGLLETSPLLSEAAYNQGDEAQYLSNFDQTIAASYAAIDDNELAPADLLLQCKDMGVVYDFSTTAMEVIVQPDDPTTKTVTASSVQAQCGRDNAISSTPIICILPAGIRLYMTSNLVVDAFIVRGELYWRDIDQSLSEHQWLCAGYVAIEDQGKFIMNVQQSETSWIYLMDNGAVHPIGRSRYFGGVAPHNGTTSHAAHHPVVDIKGRTLTRTWSLLSNPFRSGETKMNLMHSPVRMGWHIGDRIGIASTVSSSAGTGQTFRIVSMEGNTITVDDVANQHYRADFYPPNKLGETNTRDPYAAALLSAEVVNLNRNIIITGDDYRHVPCDSTLTEAVLGEQTSTEGCKCSSFRTQCTAGLHTAQMHAGTMSIRSTRVEKCGQRGIEGKYCLHFHKLRTCADCMFKDNVIEQSHQRGIIVHGTHLSTVSNNVLWDVRGASIYIEDGNEMYNHIKYNVVICPWPFVDQIMHGCTVPGTSNTQADTANNQAGIYTETAANDLIGNRVANAFNSMFLQANGQGRGEAYGKVCTNHLQFGRWEGNTFHGALRFGTYTLGGSEPRQTDQSIINNGYNTDRVATCAAVDVDSGYDRGEPVSILNNVDYGNVFVGHYTAGDIQHRGHKSFNNNNLIYWKETKNFADGCGSHLMDAIYEEGTMALPDQSTFIIQDTIFGKNVQLEANHHCNVGTTGFLCMPQYILHNVQWKGSGNGRWTWLQRGGTGGGGIFSLSPPDAQKIMSATSQEQSTMQDLLFPPGYVSVASGRFSSLLLGDAGAIEAGPYCTSSTALGSIEATRYDNGILCTVPLRAMKIYTRNLHIDTAPKLKVKVWYDGSNGTNNNSPDAIQHISLHATGGSMGHLKQGYTFPVIPLPSLARYRVSLVDANGDGGTVDDNIPYDWLIEFSDPVIGNRWNPEFVQMSIQGRDCGDDGRISSQHDRRYLSGLSVDDSAWGSHGACVNDLPQPPDMPLVNCSATNGGKAGAIATTECVDLCDPPCDDTNSFCHCGTGQCETKPGFVTASIDLCAAARCGEHGTCAARYLGDGTSPLPVTSPDHACICDDGWHGPLCDKPDPCLSSNRTCSGRGRCASINGYVDYCDCDEGYSGDNCEVSCDGLCEGGGGVWPYGCAGYPIGTAVKYKCGPTGGCQYLEPEQDGIASWCTYMDLSSGNDHSCTCDTNKDCQIGGICNSDGTCPTPIQVVDGTPCNSKPYGTCQAGICVELPSPAPTSEPTKSPNSISSLSPTKAPTIITSSSPTTKAPTTGALVPIQPLWAEASSVRDANTANKAIDGNLGTRWESEFSDPQWISVDLGEVYSLRTIEIAWEPAYAKSYDIQVSHDGTTWSTIFSETNGNGGVDIINPPALGSSSSSGRFARIYGTARGTIWGYSIWELKFFGTVWTNEPTTAPVVPESCEGKCAGTGPYFNCAWWKMNDQHTRSACDPNGGGGCQYLQNGQETNWCVYQSFDPTPAPVVTTTAPSKTPTIRITSNPTVAPVVVSSPTISPSMPNESCEGKCAGTGPYFGCAWWKTYDLHIKSACDPSGSGACQYLQEGQTTTWCVYQTFNVPPPSTPVSTGSPSKAPIMKTLNPTTVAPTSKPTVSPTTDPTVAPVTSPTAPLPESCEGKCAGTGPYFGCAWWKTYDLHTKSVCDPSGSGGCQYLQDGQTTNWCVYQIFDDLPPTPVSTESPSKTPTVSTLNPTVAPTSKPTVSPITSNPTVAPVASPTAPPMPESCEGKCKGSGPYFGCAWWKMNDSHTKSACDPNGGGGCQYLQEGQTTNWCIYQQF